MSNEERRVPTTAVVENGRIVGKVHRQDCFIVTTRFPDRDWQPVSVRWTCAFCERVDREQAARS